MKFVIKHEIKGRMRIHIMQNVMTYREADILYYYLSKNKDVISVKVHERVENIIIYYNDVNREKIIALLKKFSYGSAEVPSIFLQNSGRELSVKYEEKLVNKVCVRLISKILLPYTIRYIIITVKSMKYIIKGLHVLMKKKIEVPVLDATAIGVSIVRRKFYMADSIMFLLGIGEILEEWTRKKSVGDLARSMSLNVDKVWKNCSGQEVLVSFTDIKLNDKVIVHMGNVIPFDGIVVEGEAMVNQASLSGEALAVRKCKDNYVYAGTILEEGQLIIDVKNIAGASKFEKIVTMIEESEKLKSSLESRAEHLADRLVPYTFLGTGLVYLFTRSISKALSVLMVDFSCALKLAMPISVLSAIKEASLYNTTIKGGKYLEEMSEADTIVFDKTGTLTKAQPVVTDIIPFCDKTVDELLCIAACMEEHFPHSIARAVVEAAKKNNIIHEEKHSKVEYIVAHGISTKIDGKKAVIGSYHFVFEDEKCKILDDVQDKFENLSERYTQLYLAIENILAAVIYIEDPVREEAKEVIASLKKTGISKVVMMTGDSERIAHTIAADVGIDEYYSEVLPEDKEKYIRKEKEMGRKVIMVGDGINDSPALSTASVGIAINDGAEIAREIADIVVGADSLYEIVTLRNLSQKLMKKISMNYRSIVIFNTLLIILGIGGVIQPATSALLHNTSTLAISVNSMKNLI